MTPKYWNKAKKELSVKDPILAKIIKTYKGEVLRSRGDAFETLARSIVGQQISVKAADSVWRKVLTVCRKVTPKKINSLSALALRQCGLSERKVSYLKDLAQHFLKGKIKPSEWDQHSNEEVIAELIAVKGIGRWTAEMFLIFHLLKPDVFPAADLGLHRAISLNYKLKYPLAPKHIKKFSTAYSPWASVAVWYLWRSLDPIPVEY